MKTGTKPKPLAERFWPKVKKAEGCWLWLASTNPAGYGMLNINRRPERAHRVAWMLERGPIPHGLHVLHKCDNPPCCNPDHLFLGTQADNMADRNAKGRTRVALGERQARATLTNEQAAKAKAYLAQFSGPSADRALAKEFGVSPQTIRGIRSNRTWKHIHPKG